MADKKTFSIQIDGIKQSVDGVENLGSAVNTNVSSIKELRTALKATKDEMAGLDKNTKQWQDLAKVAGDYKDRIDDINQATARFASDTKALDDALNIGKSMTSVYTLAQGAMNAFGKSTEGVVEQIQKMQNAMGILQSIQSLQNTLKGSTATTDLLTKAMKACTVSMEGTSTAAKVLKVSLMSIGIGLIIAAIAELIIHWDELTEAIGITNKAMEKANETFEAGVGTYAKAKAELNAYITKLETFNGTKEQEKQIVEECNKKYGEAFGHYQTLAQWKDVLKQKTEAYCKTLMMEAQMQAKVNQLTQAYQKVAEAKRKYDDRDNISWWDRLWGDSSKGRKKDFEDAMHEAHQLEDEIEEFANQIAANNSENGLFQTIVGGKKGGKNATDEAKKQLEQLKKIYGDWRKAELDAEKAIQKEREESLKKEQERLNRLKKLRDKDQDAENAYQKQKLKLDLANAKTDEEKIEIKKKIIALDQKIAEDNAKASAAEAMGMSVENLNDILQRGETAYASLNDEQKQILQTLITQLATVKMAAEEANNSLSADSVKQKVKGQKNENGEWKKWSELTDEEREERVQIITQASVDLAIEAFDTITDGFMQMMDFEVEKAQEALDEVTEMHEEQVEKVNESQEKIAELNQKMRDASGSQLEQYKQQMADEREILNQREAEEKRLEKEKEKRQKELEKQEKKRRKAEAAAQIVQAAINVALGVTKAISSFAPPANFVFAALVSALGLAQLAVMTKNYQKMAEGGLLKGKSHSQGGIPVGNTGVEVEGGEYVVNKRSTAKYLPLLQQINEEGARKKTVANQIGKYADGGQLNMDRISSTLDSINTAKMVSEAINSIDMHPVVSVVDINRGQRNYTEVRQLAGAKD